MVISWHEDIIYLPHIIILYSFSVQIFLKDIYKIKDNILVTKFPFKGRS